LTPQYTEAETEDLAVEEPRIHFPGEKEKEVVLMNYLESIEFPDLEDVIVIDEAPSGQEKEEAGVVGESPVAFSEEKEEEAVLIPYFQRDEEDGVVDEPSLQVKEVTNLVEESPHLESGDFAETEEVAMIEESIVAPLEDKEKEVTVSQDTPSSSLEETEEEASLAEDPESTSLQKKELEVAVRRLATVMGGSEVATR
jgi:hypothetical protein